MKSPFSGTPAMAGDQKRLKLVRGEQRGLVAQVLQTDVVQVVYSLHGRHEPALRHVHRSREHLCPARINLCVSLRCTPTPLTVLSCHAHTLARIDWWWTRFDSVVCARVPPRSTSPKPREP